MSKYTLRKLSDKSMALSVRDSCEYLLVKLCSWCHLYTVYSAYVI
jgi:hypothetical protein